MTCRVPHAAFLSFGDSSDADWLFSFAKAAGPTASLELHSDQGNAEARSASPAAASRAPLPAADATTSAEVGTGGTAGTETGAASLSDPAAEEPVMSELALEPPAESQPVSSAPDVSDTSVPELAAAPELGVSVSEPAPEGLHAEDAAHPATAAAPEPGTRASAETEAATRTGDAEGPTMTEPEAQEEEMLHAQRLSAAVEAASAALTAHQAAGADMSSLSAPGEEDRPDFAASLQCGSASSRGDLLTELSQITQQIRTLCSGVHIALTNGVSCLSSASTWPTSRTPCLTGTSRAASGAPSPTAEPHTELHPLLALDVRPQSAPQLDSLRRREAAVPLEQDSLAAPEVPTLPREHPLLSFDPFAQQLPPGGQLSPPRPEEGSVQGLWTVPPPDFAAELDFPLSPPTRCVCALVGIARPLNGPDIASVHKSQRLLLCLHA